MSATSAITGSDAGLQEQPEVFWDALFRTAKGKEVLAPQLSCPVADSHAHLDMLSHPELALARCAAHGVDFVVSVIDPAEDAHTTYENLKAWEHEALRLLDEWGIHVPTPRVRAIIGCHPHNASRYTAQVEEALIKGASNPLTSAIGEIGLDYHYDLSPRPRQQEVFKRQLALANEMILPVALHIREAHADALSILEQEGMPLAGTLLHCFNLDFETLKPFLKLGCHVAYGGPLTFKKSDELRQAAKQTPVGRIITETDAPYMAPEPLRGTMNSPENTVFTAQRLVDAFGYEGRKAVQLLTQVYENARNFFDRDTSSWQDNPKAIQILLDKAAEVAVGLDNVAAAEVAMGLDQAAPIAAGLDQAAEPTNTLEEMS